MAADWPALPSGSPRSLRERAEAQLAARAGEAPDPSPEETRRLLYELRVHQIELEIQNEELRQAQVELAQSRDRYLELYDYAPVGYLTLDRDDMVREANLTLIRMLDRPRGKLIGRPITPFVAPESQDALYRHAQQVLASGLKQVCELILRRSDGTTFEARLETVPATDPLTGAPLTRTAVLDVSAERAAERSVQADRAAWENRLKHMAYLDSLTGLPNRLLLRDRLAQALAQAKRSRKALAVMFIDLDRFKTVNDSLGHSNGDSLLRHVAQSLAAEMRQEDTLARLGGDEFVVLLVDLDRKRRIGADAALIACKLLAAAAIPFRIEGREIRPSASLGIALYPEDGRDPETLMKNADSAMYHAKSLGRGTYQFYSREMNEQAIHRLDVEADLGRALENHELLLYFQPKIRIPTCTITGAEALVRWLHPTKGLVPPGEFIELAEETGMIVQIGQWVLDEACRQAARLTSLGFGNLSMGVNISPRQFREPGLVKQVQTALSSAGLPPHMLEIEITEGSAVENRNRALNVLEAFKELGALLSLDDFGTGYASLGYIKHFPVNVIKIDGSFTQNLETDPKDAAIVSTIITLAHSLGMKVVAEGVETDRQLQLLRAQDCDQGQGYLFSRPVPFDRLVELLRRDRAPRAGLAAPWCPPH